MVLNDFMVVNEIVSAAMAQANVRLHCDDDHFSITIDDEHDGDLHNVIVNPKAASQFRSIYSETGVYFLSVFTFFLRTGNNVPLIVHCVVINEL